MRRRTLSLPPLAASLLLLSPGHTVAEPRKAAAACPEVRAPTTCPVGSCPQGDSPQGLHDLAGGVAEWTATPSPRPPADGTQRLVCGGQTSCEAGSINRVGPSSAAGFCFDQEAKRRFEGVGFRCARAP